MLLKDIKAQFSSITGMPAKKAFALVATGRTELPRFTKAVWQEVVDSILPRFREFNDTVINSNDTCSKMLQELQSTTAALNEENAKLFDYAATLEERIAELEQQPTVEQVVVQDTQIVEQYQTRIAELERLCEERLEEAVDIHERFVAVDSENQEFVNTIDALNKKLQQQPTVVEVQKPVVKTVVQTKKCYDLMEVLDCIENEDDIDQYIRFLYCSTGKSPRKLHETVSIRYDSKLFPNDEQVQRVSKVANEVYAQIVRRNGGDMSWCEPLEEEDEPVVTESYEDEEDTDDALTVF